ncbi:MAG TPA: phosphoribosyl-AMP cyclohydrolase [Acidimicrobiales bacterium]|nr:phosphoribosyl-AMP cyclohydrolase [Acidimicrobiales bacterium]
MPSVEETTTADIGFGKIQQAGSSARPLVPVVLQNADTGDVLFVGYADRSALEETLDTGRATLWSTSREELWRKGATSGDVLNVVDVRVNCEQNSLLYLVRPTTGGVCHSTDAAGAPRPTCFYRRVTRPDLLEFVEGFGPSSSPSGGA